MDQIPWWQSRTIWMLAISSLLQVLNAAGKHVDPALQGTIVDVIMQIISVGTAIGGVYYRVKATSTIITPVNPVAPKGNTP